MKAVVVLHAVGDIRLDDVPDGAAQRATDAVVRFTPGAVYGAGLHRD